jgi:RNA polymerase sigma factor (sigma-70 family)
MLCDEPLIWDILERIVCSVIGSHDWHDDMLQESLIHLWQKEIQFPGQTTSWYLHSCRCYVCDCLRRGVSLDSPKRSSSGCELKGQFYDSEPIPDCLILDEETLSSACANDVLEQLMSRLDNLSRNVLLCLNKGFNEREVGQRVGLSQQAVSRRRLKIATLALTLGILPASLSTPRREAI